MERNRKGTERKKVAMLVNIERDDSGSESKAGRGSSAVDIGLVDDSDQGS